MLREYTLMEREGGFVLRCTADGKEIHLTEEELARRMRMDLRKASLKRKFCNNLVFLEVELLYRIDTTKVRVPRTAGGPRQHIVMSAITEASVKP